MWAERERTYYYHSDHLGSAQVVTNWRGQIHERLEYTPYGELWIDWKGSEAPQDGTPFRFTGKELDAETGLYYYGARYLDPKTSRWLSADPAMGEYVPSAPVNDEARKRNGNLPGMGGVFNVVNLHTYHYAGNNPVKYTDPDGRYLGLKDRASKFSISFEGRNTDIDVALKASARTEINSIRNNGLVRLKERIDISRTLGLTPSEKERNYFAGETTRFIAFTEVRGRDQRTNDHAEIILRTAETTYKDAYSEARFTNRKRELEANIYAENKANEVIDEFIKRYNPEYVPPEPLVYTPQEPLR